MIKEGLKEELVREYPDCAVTVEQDGDVFRVDIAAPGEMFGAYGLEVLSWRRQGGELLLTMHELYAMQLGVFEEMLHMQGKGSAVVSRRGRSRSRRRADKQS